MSEAKQNGATRRDFLNIAWGAAGALVLGEAAFIGLRFLAPRRIEGEFGGIFNVGSADDFPPGSVTPVEAGRFYLVRLQDGGLMAMYRRCTHLGCAVPYDPASGKFVCPCHGSAFTLEGDVLNPPAARPLDLFALVIEDGQVIVDTGRPIERDAASPSDIVYA
jgi:cytochrome b6-f complex iron-sulfur subunit